MKRSKRLEYEETIKFKENIVHVDIEVDHLKWLKTRTYE